LGELFGKPLVFRAGGVKVAFRSFGADAQCVAGLFQGGDAGVGGRGELVERVLVVGADAGGLVGCGGLGVLGADNSCGLGLAGTGCLLLGLPGARLGIGDLAGGVVASGAYVAVRVFACLQDFRGCGVAGAAYLCFGDRENPLLTVVNGTLMAG
jgi:hypothetical protein